MVFDKHYYGIWNTRGHSGPSEIQEICNFDTHRCRCNHASSYQLETGVMFRREVRSHQQQSGALHCWWTRTSGQSRILRAPYIVHPLHSPSVLCTVVLHDGMGISSLPIETNWCHSMYTTIVSTFIGINGFGGLQVFVFNLRFKTVRLF